MSDALKGALKAMDDYIAGLNANDEKKANDACHFPHVRLASGKVTVWQTRGDYKIDGFKARAGDGWHHSTWDERTPIHVGPDKVHLKVKFSRWRADNSLIGTFETIYILTKQEGRWGIQARSSFAA